MSTLIELNALRIAANLKPLKSWKESKAKLDAAVAKLSGVPVAEAKVVEVKKIPTGMTADKAAKADNAKLASAAKASGALTMKANPAAKTTKPAAKKEASTGTTISTIAKKLGIDPKVARAKLRRVFGDADGTGKDGSRWEFTAERVKEIETILKGDARKKD